MAGKSVNKVILVGNLGKDPEVKYTPQGTPVAKFSLATNERFKDKDGQWQDRTEWHNITAWARTAEIAGPGSNVVPLGAVLPLAVYVLEAFVGGEAELGH